MKSQTLTHLLLVSILSLSGCQNLSNQAPDITNQSEPTQKTRSHEREPDMQLTSSAFNYQANIPAKFTCDGKNYNPPLTIQNAPQETHSFALIVDDPDAPSGTFTHWMLWNIPASTTTINQNETPPGAVVGTNSFGDTSYGGPCPPSGTHRYIFTLFALNNTLELTAGSEKEDLLNALDNHIIEETQLIGTYSRK